MRSGPHYERALIARLTDATVEIPLRGLNRTGNDTGDPRIFQDRNGAWKLRALDRISMSIYSGDRIGVSGPNGSGKTTLLRLLGGLLPLASGTLELFGNVRPLISIGAGLSFALTGRQNTILQHRMLNIEAVPLQKFIDNVVDFTGLGEFFEMPMSTYSPGMVTRLQFAVNTVEPPDLFLLDEWIGVADEAFYEKAQRRLNDYIAGSEALVCASHNQALLKTLCGTRILLDRGKVEHIGA